jgi:hypothetical protein
MGEGRSCAFSIVFLVALLALLSACADAAPPALAPSPGPDDPVGPSAEMPYRPVMAGTAYFGVGVAP